MPHGFRTRDTRIAQMSSLGRLEPRTGRPTYLAHGPHRLIFDAWQLLTGSQGRFQGVELQSSAESTMAPSYKYKGRG